MLLLTKATVNTIDMKYDENNIRYIRDSIIQSNNNNNVKTITTTKKKTFQRRIIIKQHCTVQLLLLVLVVLLTCIPSGILCRVTVMNDDDYSNNDSSSNNNNNTTIYTKRYISIQTSTKDHIGKTLWNEYEYYARLQYIPTNIEVCPSTSTSTSISISTLDDNYNNDDTSTIKDLVVVPTKDGLPIALLVHQGSSCTIEQTIKYVMQRINSNDTSSNKDTPSPSNPTVRFLLIDDLPTPPKKRRTRSLSSSVSSVSVSSSSSSSLSRSSISSSWRKLWENRIEKVKNKQVQQQIQQQQQQQKEKQYQQEKQQQQKQVPTSQKIRQQQQQQHQQLQQQLLPDMSDFDYYEYENVPIYIIHISKITYNSLLDIITTKQSNYTRSNGGIKLTIDAHTGLNNDWNDNEIVFILIAIGCMIGTIGCIVWIFYYDNPARLSNDTLFERQRQILLHRQRQQDLLNQGPRKLTIEHVEQLLPIYVYDGSILYTSSPLNNEQEEDAEIDFTSKQQRALLVSTSISTTRNTSTGNLLDTVEEDGEDDDIGSSNRVAEIMVCKGKRCNNSGTNCTCCTAGTDTTDDTDTTTVIKQSASDGSNNSQQSSSSSSSPTNNKIYGPAINLHDLECSICLDEYDCGMQVRVLPCGHPFHSKCVERWLTERSATCPLCKYEIYPIGYNIENDNEHEQEVDDDNDNDDNDSTIEDVSDNNTTTIDDGPIQRTPPIINTSIWTWLFSSNNNPSTTRTGRTGTTSSTDAVESELQTLTADENTNNDDNDLSMNNNDNNTNMIQPLESSQTPLLLLDDDDDDMLLQPIELQGRRRSDRMQQQQQQQQRFVSASMWRRLVWNVTTALNGLPTNNSDDNSTTGPNSMMMVETTTSSSSSPSSVTDMLREPLLEIPISSLTSHQYQYQYQQQQLYDNDDQQLSSTSISSTPLFYSTPVTDNINVV